MCASVSRKGLRVIVWTGECWGARKASWKRGASRKFRKVLGVKENRSSSQAVTAYLERIPKNALPLMCRKKSESKMLGCLSQNVVDG
jgi:hypothetical protein